MFNQWLYNFILHSRQISFFEIVRFKIAKKMEQLLLRIDVPLVSYSLHGTNIILPWTHLLPVILKKYPCYSDNLARIGNIVHAHKSGITLVDIGANIGDSVILLRRYAQFPILCIEGDDYYFQLLQKNLASFQEVWTHRAMVGTVNEERKGSVQRHSGTGSLTLHEKNESTVQIHSLSFILSQYPQFASPTIIKIDTDGFDLAILRGAAEVLQKSHPILFFEYDPYFLSLQSDDGLSIFPFLSAYGYDYILVYDNYGEFLCSASCTDTEKLSELHHYMTGRNGEYYYDLCILHRSESKLFQQLRTAELTERKP